MNKTITVEQATEILLDVSQPINDRIVAALVASEFDTPELETALIRLAKVPESELASYVSEALAEIWIRRGTPNIEMVKAIPYNGQQAIKSCYLHHRPEWLALFE